ncbi:unnamed protein product [Caenorhabditis angaria]|uniref:Uncharacterized protein n=1 Tax=Caenorhabditis angaria TaxID=860376 RepID=A0A9P1J3A9_9PELO|nr:unnamed protein product [Caenorhabditis angaria]
MIRLFLAISIFLAIAVNATRFDVRLELICNFQQQWQYSAYFYEHDLISPSEGMHTTPVYGSVQPSSSFAAQFDYSEGDGIGDNYYEPFLALTHTCTDTGSQATATFYLGTVPVDSAGVVIQRRYLIDTRCDAFFCVLIDKQQ